VLISLLAGDNVSLKGQQNFAKTKDQSGRDKEREDVGKRW
jgi:hypothetical protein